MFRLLCYPQRQYDVIITKKFFYQLIHFSEPPPPINGKYNIKMFLTN